MADTETVIQRIVAQERDIEGITISGGEPLEQPQALLRLLSGIRMRTHLSILLFSGYTMAEIRQMSDGPKILDRVDVLIAGRYVQAGRLTRGLRGSAGQAVHLLTDRYSLWEIEAVPSAELLIDADGNVSITGIQPPFIATSSTQR